MKSLKNYIFESRVENDLSKCKTLEEFICRFEGVKSLSELTQDDMEAYDLGFIWFGDDFADLTIDEFVEKVKSYGNAKIENLHFDSNNGIVTFTCNGDDFDLDYVDE